MSYSTPGNESFGKDGRKKPPGFTANAWKRKRSFLQLFAMSGVLFLSVRSLGQKYRIRDLREDIGALEEEQERLADRMTSIKNALYHEASFETSGNFASRLRMLFQDND